MAWAAVPFMAVFFVVADLLFSVTPICLWGFCVWSLFCYALFNDLSSFAIIFMRKGVLVALLNCLSDVL